MDLWRKILPRAEGPESPSFPAAKKCLSNNAEDRIVVTKKQDLAVRFGLRTLGTNTEVRRHSRFMRYWFTLGHLHHFVASPRCETTPGAKKQAMCLSDAPRKVWIFGLGEFIRIRRVYRNVAPSASSWHYRASEPSLIDTVDLAQSMDE